MLFVIGKHVLLMLGRHVLLMLHSQKAHVIHVYNARVVLVQLLTLNIYLTIEPSKPGRALPVREGERGREGEQPVR